MNNTEQQISQLYRTFGSADFSGNWIAQDWVLRDMAGYSATNKIQFFANPAGSLDPVLGVQKKREQANFTTPNQIGGDFFFIVTHVRMFLLNSAKARQTGTNVATDTLFSARQLRVARLMTAIMSQGVLRWTINQKIFLLQAQPFQTFAAGFGLGEIVPPAVGFTDGTPAAVNGGANAVASVSSYDFDGGERGDSFSLAQPVVLAPSTTFQVDLEFPIGTGSPSPANVYGDANDQPATIWVGCYLCGQKVRPRS